MLENEGEWIQLMRTAKSANEANVCLLLSGGKVVCRVIKPISEGVELTVTCCLNDQKIPPDIPFYSEHENNDIILSSFKSATPVTDMLDSSSESASPDRNKSEIETKSPSEGSFSEIEDNMDESIINRRQNIIVENTMSSPSLTSQQHRNKTISIVSKRIANQDTFAKRLVCRPPNGISYDLDSLNDDSIQLHKCPHCTYFFRSDKHLLQHMKTHVMPQTVEIADTSTSNRSFCVDCNIQFMSPNTYKVHKEIYCRARHKENQNENVLKSHSNILSSTEPLVMSDDVFLVRKDSFNVIPPVIQPCAFFAALSTNPLVLLPCSLVNSQGVMQHNSSIISTGAPITLPAGITGSAIVGRESISLYPEPIETRNTNRRSISLAVPQSPPNDDEPELSPKTPYKAEESALDLKKHNSELDNEIITADSPLDLTTKKRKSFSLDSRELYSKTRRKNSFPLTSLKKYKYFSAAKSLSPEPNHSLMNSRAAISPPSISNDAINSRGTTVIFPRFSPQIQKDHSTAAGNSPESPIQAQPVENEFLSQQNILTTTLIPNKIHKQGNNRCEDCNIVFYKYDNYLAHKRHYCAYRRQKIAEMMDRASVSSDASNADDNNNEPSPQTIRGHDEEKNSYSTDAAAIGSHSSPYTCDNCGVKFSTADNLNAHQTYYCTRKSDASNRAMNSAYNRNSGVRELLYYKNCEPYSELPEELTFPSEWKCNYCDTVCSSLQAANRHLLIHSEARGFCCVICGYRGNTLRGMRTHIYEHLNKESPHIDELLASSIVPDIGIPTTNYNRGIETSDEEGVNFHKRVILRDESSRDCDENMTSQIEMKHQNFENGKERAVSEDRCSSPRQQSKTSSSPNSEASNKSLFKTILPNSEPNKHTEAITDHSAVEVKVEVIDNEDCEVDYSHCRYNAKSSSEAEDSDIEVKIPIKKENQASHGMGMSVICQASVSNPNTQESHYIATSKTIKEEPPTKKAHPINGELKYCKACDITFHHLSNYIAHKKFYCISRVVRHFQQETAPVQ